MYYKINNEYYLDENDVGKLVTIKCNHSSLLYTANKHENCLILAMYYSEKDNIRPSFMHLLNQEGKLIRISFYKTSQIEIKYL